jgi:hypothetical protein
LTIRSPAEIIEPDITAASPAGAYRYFLLVEAPFAYLKGRDGAT